MSNPTPFRVWALRGAFFLVGLMLILLQLMPFETIPAHWSPYLLQTAPADSGVTADVLPGTDPTGQVFERINYPKRWIAPDFLLAFCLAWALRRPDLAPSLAIGAVILLADFLFDRPPGLMALLVVLGAEWLRRRARPTRRIGFVREWALVGVVLAGIVITERLILAVFLLDLPVLWLSGLRAALTFLAYPLVVGLSWMIFGIGKPTPHEGHSRGTR